MELSEFIQKTLVAVMKGVKDAQSTSKDGVIVPEINPKANLYEFRIANVQTIELEIGIAATGSDVIVTQKEVPSSRLTMVIPISLPVGKQK